MTREIADVVVVGAGFAGASTAYHLCRTGARRVLVLERESAPGQHASGRNAALADPVSADPVHAALLLEGLRFLREPPEEFPSPALLSRTGSLRIGSRLDLERLREASVAGPGGPGGGGGEGEVLESIQPSEAARRVPLLEGADMEAALWCPAGGVVDIHALLQGYLRGFSAAGGRVLCGSPVSSVRALAGGGFVVEAPPARIEAGAVVNAAGAWAAEVGRLAGAVSVPLTPYRRHLFQSGPLPGVDPRWPFVWDETRQFYFRPESGGLLLSPCDQVPHPPEEPREDPAARELLAEKLSRAVPALAGVRLARGWACLRTFASGSRFVVGEDPQLPGFFWVAGLGGSGMTASAALGRLAAQAVLGAAKGRREADPLSPARFAPRQG